jgi:hypothetical protein
VIWKSDSASRERTKASQRLPGFLKRKPGFFIWYGKRKIKATVQSRAAPRG